MAFQVPIAVQQNQAQQHQAAIAEALSYVLRGDAIGQWASDHKQEAKSNSGWNYLAIAAIGRQAARAHSYVYSREKQSLRKMAKSVYGSKWRSMAQDGSASPVPDDHWVSQMVDRPNRAQHGSLFRWEFIQQMHLHGCCFIFNRPTEDGTRTAARYILPVAMTQPVYAGQDKDAPNGGLKVSPYDAGLGFYVHPLLRKLTNRTIPIEQISVVRYPHSVLRGDGFSPTDAAGWWIDVANMVDETRWKHMKRGPRPSNIITFDEERPAVELDEVEKRVNRKLDDEYNENRAIALGSGAKLEQYTTPNEMEYGQSFDQLGKAILAIHGVSEAMVGLSEGMTYGSLAAAMLQGLAVVQSDLDLLAGEWTTLVNDEGFEVDVDFETQPFDDLDLIERQLQTDITAGSMTMREYRGKRGLPPWGDWRDDARVTSMGLIDDRNGPQAIPGQPMVGEPGQPNSERGSTGEFSDLSRRQWTNNLKAVEEVLEKVIDGRMSENRAQVELSMLGVDKQNIERLLEDVRDGQLDQILPDTPEAKEAAQALNGAQVTSLVTIVQQIGSGAVTKEVAKPMLEAAFPSFGQELIDSIVDPVQVREDELAKRYYRKHLTKRNAIRKSLGPKSGPTIAVDLDGTLATYESYEPDEIGTPIRSTVELVNKLHAIGCQIIVFTCRDSEYLVAMWLEDAGVSYDAINETPGQPMGSGKVLADIYLDDRAVNIRDGLQAVADMLPPPYADKLLGVEPEPQVGVVMLEVPPDVASRIKSLSGSIPKDMLAGDGVEEWPHITLLYGIYGSIDQALSAVQALPSVEVEVGPMGYFRNPDKSVCKLEVRSAKLHEMHRKLADALPNEQKWPEYQPHITLAYVSEDVRQMDDLKGLVFECKHAVLSMDGRKIRVPLRPVVPQNGHAKRFQDVMFES